MTALTDRRAAWAVVAVALLVFAPTLVLGRVSFDDAWLWGDDSPLRAPTAATWRHVWLELDATARRDLGSEYLPVRDMAVALDMAVWGDLEHGQHATQLALYLLTVVGLGYLLRRLGLRRELAWLAALLWAIHPLHVESVAWLSERKGILAGMFVVGCGHAWLRYRDGGRAIWLAIAALAAAAATWSKAPAMFAPAVFAAWDGIARPAARQRWIAIAVVGIAAAAAALPVIAVAREAGVVDSAREPARGTRIERALGAQGHYVLGAVLARAPSLAYRIQTRGPDALELSVGGAAVLASLALWWPRRREDAAPEGAAHDAPTGALTATQARRALLAWAWIWFLPISHLAAAVHIAVADRFAYLWLLGGCAGAAWLVLQLRGPMRLAAGGALVCALGIAALRAQLAWTQSTTLFAHAFDANPDDVHTCERLANELMSEGEHRAALRVLARGLAENPEHPVLLQFQATALDKLGRHDEALAVASRATVAGRSVTLMLYAQLLHQAGRADEALDVLARAIARRPDLASYAHTRIRWLLALDRPAEAEAVARAWLARHPVGHSHVLLGLALLRQGKRAEAAAHLALAGALGGQGAELDQLRRGLAP